MKILLFAFVLSAQSFAQHEVIVQSLDPDVDLTQMEGEGFKKVVGLEPGKNLDELPSLQAQNALFKKADLEKDVKGFDQIDKDLFYKAVKAYPTQKVSTLFPKISVDKIKKLKLMITGKK